MTPELLNKSGKFTLFRRRSNHCRLLSNKEVFNYGHRRQKYPLNRNLKIAENFKPTPCKQFSAASVYKIPAAKNFEYSHSPFVNNELTFPRWTEFIFRENLEPIYIVTALLSQKVGYSLGLYTFPSKIFMATQPIFVFQLLYTLNWKKSNFHEGKKTMNSIK